MTATRGHLKRLANTATSSSSRTVTNLLPFVAHLVQLGEHRFLDLCPDESSLDDLKRDELYKVALIPGRYCL